MAAAKVNVPPVPCCSTASRFIPVSLRSPPRRNANITTIEGLEKNGTLSPVQQAFVEEGAFQCGYCTSGMVLRATALLNETPHPTDDQIVAYMDGNICRCGVYPRIVAAVQRASQSPSKAGGQ